MIVVKLIGGLGNQMFQYACGRSLAHLKQTTLALDKSFLEMASAGYTQRNYELGTFKLQGLVGGEEVRKEFDLNANRIGIKFKSYFPQFFDHVVFNESSADFQSSFLKLPQNTYLNGYWQDLSYFDRCRDILLQDFTLKEEPKGSFVELAAKLSSISVASIHVRRGDYVSLNNARNYHGLLPKEYYEQAIKILAQKQNGLSYFVFSDDIDWCKQNLSFLERPFFIDGKELGLSAQEELVLMSMCKHNVIANSSFSWWAAWLNIHKDNVVIAPKYWYNKQFKQPGNLFPKSWTRI